MRKKFLSSALALGLVTSLFAGVIGASADNHEPPTNVQASTAHFPFVPNGEVLDNTGPWYGAVTIQNMEDDEPIRVFAYNSVQFDTDPDTGAFNTTLQPNASKTFSADQLVDGDGSALSLIAVTEAGWQAIDDYDEDEEGEETDTTVYDAPNFSAVMKQAAPDAVSSNGRTNAGHVTVDGHTAIPGAVIAWGGNSEFCYDLLVDWRCAADGNPFSGVELFDEFDGSSYLPIVQTNAGWNTVVAVSNIDASIQNAGVNLTFIPAEGSGYGSGNIQETFTLNAGETELINLADFLASQGITDQWVGSVWIESDVGVASSAIRLKAETDMLAINTAAPSFWSSTGDVDDDQGFGDAPLIDQIGTGLEVYGPLVYKDYNGWNTGISIVNLFEQTNTVDITYYNGNGNVVQAESLTLPPRGSNFVYSAASQNLGTGFVGSVLISGEAPVHAAIDQVKYDAGQTDLDAGQAMSYIASGRGAGDETFDGAETIGMPLVQKGSINSGDTSGIQLFNADIHVEADIEVEFFLSGGSLAAPTQNSPIQMTLAPLSNATLYTMNYSQMPTNFLGSAQVEVLDGDHVVGVSNNVNYDVSGDGSVAFNMVNSFGQYRLISFNDIVRR